MLEEAARDHNDDWLAQQILRLGYLRDTEDHTRKGKVYKYHINADQAAHQLAEGEFNRYYIRGLCVRARAQGITQLTVYRGKEVKKPRPESELKLGSMIQAEALLAELRSNDFVSIEAAIGVPGGPGSGITCRLP